MAHQAAIRGVGLTMGEAGLGPPAVLLDVRDEIVPIFVDRGQAESIQRAREGVPPERPMTHDLFAGVLEDLEVTVERVRIDDLSDETFHAKLDLSVVREGTTEKMVRDARPSDGLALAVRTGSPVLVDDDVIDEAGHPPEMLRIEDGDQRSIGPTGVDFGPVDQEEDPFAGLQEEDPDLLEKEDPDLVEEEDPDVTEADDEPADLDDAVDIDIDDTGTEPDDPDDGNDGSDEDADESSRRD